MNGINKDYGNYFEKTVHSFEEDIEFLEENCEKLEAEKTPEIFEKVVSEILERFEILSKEEPSGRLRKLSWTVRNLHREEDREILTSAMEALNRFQQVFSNISEKYKEFERENNQTDIDTKQVELIHNKIREQLTEVIVLTHEKSLSEKDWKWDKTLSVLPDESDLIEEENIKPEYSDLSLSSSKKTKASYSNSVWNILSYPGRYVKSVSNLIKSYCQIIKDNSPETVKNIIRQMKEVKELNFITNAKGVVLDEYGDGLKVPKQFAVDITRCKDFFINRVKYHEMGSETLNPNEVARELYRKLGEEGAIRVMQVCNQALPLGMIVSTILPLYTEGGAWKKQFPDKEILFCNQDSGLSINVDIDEDKQLVKISIKILMNLCTPGEDEEEILANFVMKMDIEVPIEELTRADFDQLENPIPGVKVRETISTLLVNNHDKAVELLEKF